MEIIGSGTDPCLNPKLLYPRLGGRPFDSTTLLCYDIIMSFEEVVFARSADRHGFTIEDVTYAVTHPIRRASFEKDGSRYIKLTGRHHGDPLVPSIEVMMKIIPNSGVVVFHVNAEQGNFWNKR